MRLPREPAAYPTRSHQETLEEHFSQWLISERLIGFIFGWDHVDWAGVDRRRGRRYAFGRAAWAHRRSIYDRLQPLARRYDEDPTALQPSRALNRPLRQLVAIMQHRFDDVLRMPAIERGTLRLAIAAQMVRRIEGDPALAAKAQELRLICARAEDQLERHVCMRAIKALARTFPPTLAEVTRARLQRLHQQCRRRAEEFRRPHEQDDSIGWLDAARQTRIELLKSTLLLFPYLRHYEMMTRGEVRLITGPAASLPRKVREIGKPRSWDAQPAPAPHRVATMPDVTMRRPAEDHPPIGDLSTSTAVFCGGGALPLSGLMLHAMTGASVILVERDPDAARLADLLIGHLERLAVIEPGKLRLIERDAADLVFRRPGTAAQGLDGDVVVLASLLPNSVKLRIVEHLQESRQGPATLLIRSAYGLTALLGYEPMPSDPIVRGPWRCRGEAVPAPHAGLARRNARLVVTDPDVLNTTELYARSASALGTC